MHHQRLAIDGGVNLSTRAFRSGLGNQGREKGEHHAPEQIDQRREGWYIMSSIRECDGNSYGQAVNRQQVRVLLSRSNL